jgi:hypothetical protein
VERGLDKMPLPTVEAAVRHRDPVAEEWSESVEQGTFFEFRTFGNQNLLHEFSAGHGIGR